jgi:hypothetical protein
MPRVSHGFVSALAGAGVTLLAWYGPWAWPAWPAFTSLAWMLGSSGAFDELPFRQRAAILVLLIVVNVAAWGLVVRLVMAVGGRLTEGWRRRHSSAETGGL